MARKAVARLALLIGAALLAMLVVRLSRRRLDGTRARRPAPRQRTESVTPGEREAAWAVAASLRIMTERSEALTSEIAQLEAHVAELEQSATASGEELTAARRLLAVDTALANENLRLRGAVEALTAAVALRAEATEGAQRDDEVEALRAELLDLEMQLKEMADDRDRSADEADRLRATLEAIPSGTDADAARRLRDEVDRLRRSLAIERERNTRLGRRKVLDPLA